MADQSRIDDLRRRVQKDPASIAFAQLAEECRRAGQYEESIEVCRAGLALHPGYLSARVTLGRALLELEQFDEAQTALELVLKGAPENLAAIRGLAEIHHRRGSLPEALAQYRAALALARNDPDLQQTVAELSRKVEPPKPPAPDEGLSFDQLESEFLMHSPPPVVPVVRLKPDATNTPTDAATILQPDATNTLSPDATNTDAREPDATDVLPAPSFAEREQDAASVVRLKPDDTNTSAPEPDAADILTPDILFPPMSAEGKADATDTVEADPVRPSADPFAFLQDDSAQADPFAFLQDNPVDFAQGRPFDFAQERPFDSAQERPFDSAQVGEAPPLQSGEDTAARQLATQTIAALEQWLDAIHVTRAQRIA